MSTPVSGPGQFSRRTDMTQKLRDLPNPDYGEGASYKDLQKAAPMAASPGVPQFDMSQMFQGLGGSVTPLTEGTQNANEPVTNGAASGPGAGVEALGLGAPRSQQDLQNMANQLPVLEYMANQPNASWGLRNLVRNIKGAL